MPHPGKPTQINAEFTPKVKTMITITEMRTTATTTPNITAVWLDPAEAEERVVPEDALVVLTPAETEEAAGAEGINERGGEGSVTGGGGAVGGGGGDGAGGALGTPMKLTRSQSQDGGVKAVQYCHPSGPSGSSPVQLVLPPESYIRRMRTRASQVSALNRVKQKRKEGTYPIRDGYQHGISLCAPAP
ncbi:hypothetical protein K438DRAFT_1764150 [Mycena galopus ATCC 62051]|nr:hypothetical protein K438DRAFT_1764150 [Mycena galopus ATCC 62051]